MVIPSEEKSELVGRYAAILALIEVSLGSLLHAFHVPFSGNFLSLNQGYLLCRASLAATELRGGRTVGLAVSNVAAILKSLAPAGKKLGPMLSLSMQGLLFQAGISLFGASLPGLLLGMFLLSLWTFVQPVVTYVLFFGANWLKALDFVFEKTVPYTGLTLHTLTIILLAVVVVKILAALALGFWAWKSSGASELQDKLLKLALEKGARPIEERPKAGHSYPALLALRDLLNPLFLVSLAATAFFLYFSEDKIGAKIWIFLRPLAVGFIFFYFSRTLLLDRWLAGLEGTRWSGFARSCQAALKELRRYTGGTENPLGATGAPRGHVS